MFAKLLELKWWLLNYLICGNVFVNGLKKGKLVIGDDIVCKACSGNRIYTCRGADKMRRISVLGCRFL